MEKARAESPGTRDNRTRRERREDARKAKNRTPGQQAKVEAAAKVVLAGKSLGSKKMRVIPECKFPACHTRAWTTRGLCHKHEEIFLFVYFLFTAPSKKSDLLLPGEQQGGKQMTNFDMLIKGKL